MSDSVFVAGSQLATGFSAMCIGAVRRNFESRRLEIDPLFNPEAANQAERVQVGFAAAANEQPSSAASFVFQF